jgi:hypothetical protein
MLIREKFIAYRQKLSEKLKRDPPGGIGVKASPSNSGSGELPSFSAASVKHGRGGELAPGWVGEMDTGGFASNPVGTRSQVGNLARAHAELSNHDRGKYSCQGRPLPAWHRIGDRR